MRCSFSFEYQFRFVPTSPLILLLALFVDILYVFYLCPFHPFSVFRTIFCPLFSCHPFAALNTDIPPSPTSPQSLCGSSLTTKGIASSWDFIVHILRAHLPQTLTRSEKIKYRRDGDVFWVREWAPFIAYWSSHSTASKPKKDRYAEKKSPGARYTSGLHKARLARPEEMLQCDVSTIYESMECEG